MQHIHRSYYLVRRPREQHQINEPFCVVSSKLTTEYYPSPSTGGLRCLPLGHLFNTRKLLFATLILRAKMPIRKKVDKGPLLSSAVNRGTSIKAAKPGDFIWKLSGSRHHTMLLTQKDSFLGSVYNHIAFRAFSLVNSEVITKVLVTSTSVTNC